MRESSRSRSETARLKYRIPLERFFLPLRQANTKTLEGIPMRMVSMYADGMILVLTIPVVYLMTSSEAFITGCWIDVLENREILNTIVPENVFG